MRDIMRREMRALSRAQRTLEREETKTESEIKQELLHIRTHATRGDLVRAKRSAKLVHRGRARRDRLWTQQDNIRQLVDKTREQLSKTEVDHALIRVLAVMASRNGQMSPKRYGQMMQLHERAKMGQEIRDEMFEEIAGDDDDVDETAENADDPNTSAGKAIAAIMLEAGVPQAMASRESVQPLDSDTDAADLTDNLESRLSALRGEAGK